MKRKLKKEIKSILLILFLIIVILLIIGFVGVTNKDNSQNNEVQNNIEKKIDNDNKNNETLNVIIDTPKGNESTEPDNKNGEENVNNQGEENVNNQVAGNQNIVTTDKNPYYIKVNLKANTVTIYKKDSEGKYTVPVKAMICSIGEATPTSGVYKTSDMYKWRLLQGNVYGQYAVRITGHILFHSVPYTKQAKDALEWWEYDKLGTDASLGCIRLTVEDAKWIYDNCPKATQVEFYSSSTPGPLGKPTAKKISSYSEELKNWDPTDPDSKNPWKTYVEASSSSEENTVETGTSPVEPIDTNNGENIVDTNQSFNNI